MINVLLNFLLNVLLNILDVFLAPLNLIIYDNFPSFNNALLSISSFVDVVSQYFNYFIDLFGITQVALDMLIFYFSYILVVPLIAFPLKLMVKWYDKIKP